MDAPSRIAVLGVGAMGRAVIGALRQRVPEAELLFYEREHRVDALAQDLGISGFGSMTELLRREPHLVVECAGHSAVSDLVPEVLDAGIDVVVASVGALGDRGLRESLEHRASSAGALLQLVPGAVGGLDALRGAMLAGVDSVIYEGRKPPGAWKGSAAERVCSLESLTEEVTFFRGSAAEAASEYPKNANVTAAVALAGVGFESTEVQLTADPEAEENSHTLSVEGRFGRFVITLANGPLPENPRTSWLAALSVVEAVVNRTRPMRF